VAERLDEFLPLLDREEFLRRLADPDVTPPCPTGAAKAALIVDRGMTDELEDILTAADRLNPNSPFSEWARMRALKAVPQSIAASGHICAFDDAV
jgi:hypothetical protein